jgi:uncharacterized membrane protein
VGIFFRLPKIFKVLIFVFLALTLLTGAGYLLFTITAKVLVLEAITLEGNLELKLTLYPNESWVENYTLKNAGSQDIKVDIGVSISPDQQGLEAEIEPQGPITVPGNGQTSFTLTIKAEHDVVPGEYTVKVTFSR